MSWTAPRTWVTGEVVTAALLNAHLRDNLLDLLAKVVNVRLTGDVTTDQVTAQDVTGLSFAIGANEVWSFEFNLMAGSGDANGVKFAINVPASATLAAEVFGNVDTAANTKSALINADDTLSAAFLTANAQGRLISIRGVVANSTNAGTVQLRFAKVTSGTATVSANSYMTARRIG